jgi:hypothetical protein
MTCGARKGKVEDEPDFLQFTSSLILVNFIALISKQCSVIP